MDYEGEVRIPSGCAITGMISKTGERFSGESLIRSIATMHDRSNGLGGGFAGYGIYPAYADCYAFHVFYDNLQAKEACETFITRHFEIAAMSELPTKKHPGVKDEPLIWRYFLAPLQTKIVASQLDEKEYVVRCVMRVNAGHSGAYIFSCGKNMGVFKAVGFPEDVGVFYCLDEYKGYCWTSHGRYPTNTPGWWGGAHPFAILDYSVVHNGEISSYDANRRYIEMFGYQCCLQTDTEVIAYIIDFLHRRKGLTMEEAAKIIAAPFWSTIATKEGAEKEVYAFFRKRFPSLLITGPFSIMVGFENGLMVLNDRLKLRSMVIGEKGDRVCIASEECALREIYGDFDRIWYPRGGEAVVIQVETGKGGQ
ncbi:MAG TPA: glutamine amidotransferase family protein [Clostridiales bacterium]|nr:glutamine amidotransferase family protein [Clostridiales bacterium]